MASKILVGGLVGTVLLGIGVAGAQPRQDDSGAADLKNIMWQLGRDMDAVNAALWARDFGGLESAATAIADHPQVSAREKARVQAVLGADFSVFAAADRRVHDAAVRTAAAAAKENLDDVLSELGRLQVGCVACHEAFRDRLQDSVSVKASTPTGDASEIDRGAQVFASYCAVCHGPAGKGGGPAATALVPPPPDLTGPRPPHLRGIRRRAIIENGSPGSAMAAWKGVLTADDLEAVYGFVHAMHWPMRHRGGGGGRGRQRGLPPGGVTNDQ